MSTFRSRRTLERWVAEFNELGYRVPGSLRVIAQDPSGGANTGLVVMSFENVPLNVFVQPVEIGATSWAATIEPHEDPAQLTSVQLVDFSSELVSVSALVAFFEAKSAAGADESGEAE